MNNICKKTRLKINKISTERKYITKRFSKFAQPNIQKLKIGNYNIELSISTYRTILKYNYDGNIVNSFIKYMENNKQSKTLNAWNLYKNLINYQINQ